jgi:hypothetical protein
MDENMTKFVLELALDFNLDSNLSVLRRDFLIFASVIMVNTAGNNGYQNGECKYLFLAILPPVPPSVLTSK